MTKTFIALMLCVAVMGSIATGAAWAASCGGATPCSCGDTLTASRTLTKNDPIVTSVCPADGLTMNTAGTTLDLNTFVLYGSGDGVGILINAANVTIKNGGVDQFGIGIGTAAPTTGATIRSIRPNLNTLHGIYLESAATSAGQQNQLITILAKRNGLDPGDPGNGVTVVGDFNVLEGHNDEYNGLHGIYVVGDNNTLVGNFASENRKVQKGVGDGIRVEGNNNTLTENRASKLNTLGIVVIGNQNTLTGNLARKQDDDGIVVTGDGNELDDNRGMDNKGQGIVVTGVGNPAASTGNVVSGNRQSPQCVIYGTTAAPTCKIR